MAKQPKILTGAQIDEFVDALRATVAAAETGIRLREVIASLGETPAQHAPKAAPRQSVAPAAPTARRGRRARRPGIDPAKALAVLTGAKGGMALGQVAVKLGRERKDRVSAALMKLRAQKKAVVKGERGKAKWFAA